MSCFKNPRFAKELAYRTMVNYYLLRDHVPDDITKSPELQYVIEKMRTAGFKVSLRYEVTLALNSMVGLLILPQQEYFSESMSSCGFCKLSALKTCMQSKEYKNTYKEDKNKPAFVIKHMRNAVTHGRIMFIPESADNQDITHIRFRDAAYLDGKRTRAFMGGGNLDTMISEISEKYNDVTIYEFDLRISVDKLESVLMEIAEYLINFQT